MLKCQIRVDTLVPVCSSIVEPTPALVARRCAGFSIRRAARAVAALYDRRLQPVGLKGTQFSLLTAIHLMAGSGMQVLAETMWMNRTTLTRNLRPLQTRGLVQVTAGVDQRAREVFLTHEGERLLQLALPLWAQAQAQVEALLGEERLERLRQDLIELESLELSE